MRSKEKEKYERELSILTSNISNILNQYVENICKKKFAIKKKRIAIISFYYYHWDDIKFYDINFMIKFWKTLKNLMIKMKKIYFYHA